MKPGLFLFVIALLFAFISCQNMGTPSEEPQIPDNVTEGFAAKYPDAMEVEWTVEGDHFEAEFKESGMEMSVLYDAEGNVVEAEVGIDVATLHDTIVSYINITYPGAGIEEACKVENANGTFFEVDIRSQEVESIELLFDKEGNFVKMVVEEEDEGEVEE